MNLLPSDSPESPPSIPLPKDCRTALVFLDTCRPGESDPQQLVQAERHLADCQTCRQIHFERQRFDQHVSRLMVAVEVPADGISRLKQRLADELAVSSKETADASKQVADGDSVSDRSSEARPDVVPTDSVRRSRLLTRRRMLQWGGVIAVCVLALVLVQQWLRLPQTSFSEVVAAVGALNWRNSDLPTCERLQDRTEPHLPDQIHTDQIRSAPRELQVANVRGAVFFFSFGRRGAKPVEAALTVLPARQLADVPEGVGFLSTNPIVSGDLCVTAWIEQGVAYICCVRGTSSDLRELAVRRPSA